MYKEPFQPTYEYALECDKHDELKDFQTEFYKKRRYYIFRWKLIRATFKKSREIITYVARFVERLWH